jgi:ribA/ribD-fused uncharacterized protein
MSIIAFYSHKKKYGYMSNFYECKYKFTYQDRVFDVCCSEQAFMIGKALVFKCKENELIIDQILQETDPTKIKKLGRKILFFNQERWEIYRYEVMKAAVLQKFSQNKEIKDMLLETYPLELVEASKYDNIWGIGHDSIVNRDMWGMNLLGKILEEVRIILI